MLYRSESLGWEQQSLFQHISVYLLSCIELSLNHTVDAFVLMFLVGYIYITNDLIYLNPTLYMMGYRACNAKLYAEATGETVEGVIVCKNGVDMGIGKKIGGTGKYSLIVSNRNWEIKY